MPGLKAPPRKVSRLLKHLERAVGRPGIRCIGKPLPERVVGVEISHANIRALERLMRTARGRTSSTRSSVTGSVSRQDSWGEAGDEEGVGNLALPLGQEEVLKHGT